MAVQLCGSLVARHFEQSASAANLEERLVETVVPPVWTPALVSVEEGGYWISLRLGAAKAAGCSGAVQAGVQTTVEESFYGQPTADPTSCRFVVKAVSPMVADGRAPRLRRRGLKCALPVGAGCVADADQQLTPPMSEGACAERVPQ
jgi:hypothetical protein